MIETLRVAALPLNIVQGDREANLAKVEQLMAKLPPETDIVVLPEFFSTGFVSTPEELSALSETGTGSTMQRIAELARRFNMAIAGSFLARVAHQYFNRGFFMEPSGEENFYDKRHLFGLSPESKTYRAGEKPMPIVRFRGWNIALMICYDLRFPVWSRSRHNEYDVLLVPANWPQIRSYAWEHLLIARAIENQAYVVGANRAGSDAHGVYDNETVIYDFLGRPIAQASPEIVYAEFSAEKLVRARTIFPVANDADDFSIVL